MNDQNYEHGKSEPGLGEAERTLDLLGAAERGSRDAEFEARLFSSVDRALTPPPLQLRGSSAEDERSRSSLLTWAGPLFAAAACLGVVVTASIVLRGSGGEHKDSLAGMGSVQVTSLEEDVDLLLEVLGDDWDAELTELAGDLLLHDDDFVTFEDSFLELSEDAL